MKMHLFLSSKAAFDVFKLKDFTDFSKEEEYSPFDFVVDIPGGLDFSQGEWEVALLEVHTDTGNQPTEDLYVYTDIVPYENFVLDSFRPLLRVVRQKGEVGNPIYVPVQSHSKWDRIRIYIRNKQGNVPSLSIGDLSCTLHIVKK